MDYYIQSLSYLVVLETRMKNPMDEHYRRQIARYDNLIQSIQVALIVFIGVPVVIGVFIWCCYD